MPDATETATLDLHGKIATLTLRRPGSRNALSVALIAALRERVAEATARAQAGEITACIVTGEGRAFCAGMDLKAVLDDPAAPGVLLHALAELTLELRVLPCVTLASVNGAAIGGGCGLACVCDVAITHADSKMGFPEVDLGVCPAVVAPWLVRKIGAGRARRVLLSGGVMSGTQAHAMGMVDHLVASVEELHPTAVEVAGRLAAGGPLAIRATKGLLNELDGSIDAGVVRRGADLSAKVIATEETRAMLRAALGK